MLTSKERDCHQLAPDQQDEYVHHHNRKSICLLKEKSDYEESIFRIHVACHHLTCWPHLVW